MIVLKYDPGFMRWLENSGVVFDESDDADKLLHAYLDRIPEVFPEINDYNLLLVYAYDMNEQRGSNIDNGEFRTDRLKRADAITCRDHAFRFGLPCYLFAIGLSDQGLICGQDYAIMLFLHELCHILQWEKGCNDDHDYLFHRTLDTLIARWNAATGANVQNDYYGLKEET